MKNRKSSKLLPVKLIFNPTAGKTDASPSQLVEIITELQKKQMAPEVYVFDGSQDLKAIVKRALRDETNLVVASGGDGTIDSVAAELAGTDLTLGILPTGTSNNLALNLRIPRDLDEAADLLRSGVRVKIDMGVAKTTKEKSYFLELATLGLITDIYSPGDDFRRGDVLKAGEVISTIASSTPSLITLKMDNKKELSLAAYSLMVTNMPYIGRNFRLDRSVSFRDRRLDVFVFTELSKFGLVNYAIRYLQGEINDETVQHFRVKKVSIAANPEMAINVDGRPLAGNEVTISVKPEALHVMAGTTKGHGPRKAEVADLIKTTNG
ncbi:MAG: diacylglycerol kinase family protein [Anaerolineales bacterium]